MQNLISFSIDKASQKPNNIKVQQQQCELRKKRPQQPKSRKNLDEEKGFTNAE